MRRNWLCGLLLLAAGTASARVDSTANLRLVAGVDTNPLRLAADGADAAWGEIGFEAALTLPAPSPAAWFLEADGEQRRHTTGLAAADRDRIVARTGLRWSPARSVSGLTILAGVSWERSRSTFVDRLTGEPYEVPSRPPTDPATTIPIPARFDAAVAGAFLDARWNAGRRVRLALRARAERADYLEDYGSTTALEPLDHARWTLEPLVRVGLGSRATLELSMPWTAVRYEARRALDPDGGPSAGALRRDRDRELRATMRLAPWPRWDLAVGAATGVQEDLHAGYYDSRDRLAWASAGRELSWRSRLRLTGLWRDLGYERAVVPDDATGELRGSRLRHLAARFERDLGRRTGLWIEGGTQRNRSADPIYTHARRWVATGLRIGS